MTICDTLAGGKLCHPASPKIMRWHATLCEMLLHYGACDIMREYAILCRIMWCDGIMRYNTILCQIMWISSSDPPHDHTRAESPNTLAPFLCFSLYHFCTLPNTSLPTPGQLAAVNSATTRVTPTFHPSGQLDESSGGDPFLGHAKWRYNIRPTWREQRERSTSRI